MAKGRGQKSRFPKAQVVSGSEESGDTTSSEVELPTYATRDFWRLVLFLLLVMGMGFSLHINNWHITVPVVVLWFGWGGVLATVGLIWEAGLSMAGEGTGDRMAELDVSESRRHELEAEKKSLIQAIKEIEFDRDLGKMSEEDATEMMKFYRARAIEVIKELDGQLDEELSVSERVKRDLEARLAVAGQGRKRPAKVAKKRPKDESDDTADKLAKKNAEKAVTPKKSSDAVDVAQETEDSKTEASDAADVAEDAEDAEASDAADVAEDAEDAEASDASSDEESEDSAEASEASSDEDSAETPDPDGAAAKSADSNVKESA